MWWYSGRGFTEICGGIAEEGYADRFGILAEGVC